MKPTLTPKQRAVHNRAVSAAWRCRKAEAEMIQALQDVDLEKVHKCFGHSSLLKYAIKELKLSEPVALGFIAVTRKAMAVPALKAAIDGEKISVALANRLVSTITDENAPELITYAETHTWKETERKLANINPRSAVPDKAKFIGKGLVQVTMTMTEEEYEDFQRASSVEAQRTGKSPSKSQTLVATTQVYLDKYDPVRKAVRALEKNSVRTEQKSKKSNDSKGRNPMPAAIKHAVNLRDQGRCTKLDENGIRCNEDRWTDTHHVIQVQFGGTNDLDNLTTLCSFHHDQEHEGQYIPALRSTPQEKPTRQPTLSERSG